MSVIDFHSHILPKADHGCNSESEAAKQLTLLHNAGVGTVVATPHFYPNRHTVSEFQKRTNDALDMLNQYGLPKGRPQIALGAEVLICENIHKMPDFEKLCIHGTNIVLLEFPMNDTWSSSLFDTVYSILDSGFTVVLAHIDRYLPKHLLDILELLDMGALAQINAPSVRKLRLKKHVLPFLYDERLVAFGTDLHGEDKKSAEEFRKLTKLKDEIFEKVSKRTQILLSNAELI